MRFAFTEDQVEFTAAVRDLLANECTPATVRSAWDSPTGRAAGLWTRLAEMGLLGVLAPEGVGGLGLSEVDLIPMLAEAGRVALPEPLSAVAAVAVPAIRDHAQSDDAERWLGEIVEGRATVGVGLTWNPAVLYPEDASVFLLEASDGLHLVDRDVVEITMVESVDGSRRLGSLDWHPSPATAMSGGVAAAERARDRAAVAAAAELLGLSDAMLELTVGYVTERKQFGVAIGTFQALKHQLADALVELEFAKPLVWRAAVSLAENDPLASLHASMAKAAASDAADHVGRVALQCHGAIAYTVEYDLHLYLKRSWALRAQDGSSALHRRRVADALLG